MTYQEMTVHFEQKCAKMSLAELQFASRDLRETLAVHKEASWKDPYVQKLWAEHDAVVVEKHKRTTRLEK